MSSFNKMLAEKMFNVVSEEDLREKLHGNWTDLTDVEFNSICDCLSKFENPRYLEIGVWWGGNFIKIAKYLEEKFSDYYLTGVDLFEYLITQQEEDQTHAILNKWNILNVAFKDELEHVIRSVGIDKFSLEMGMSHDTVRSLNQTFDVFFIDGNHTFDQTLKDAEACLEKSKKGSFLIFHNASNNIPPDPQYIEKDGGPWRVCELLRDREELRYIDLLDRCAVLEVVK